MDETNETNETNPTPQTTPPENQPHPIDLSQLNTPNSPATTSEAPQTPETPTPTPPPLNPTPTPNSKKTKTYLKIGIASVLTLAIIYLIYSLIFRFINSQEPSTPPQIEFNLQGSLSTPQSNEEQLNTEEQFVIENLENFSEDSPPNLNLNLNPPPQEAPAQKLAR